MEVNVQLVAILLITVSALAVLSGLSVLIGSSKNERAISAWFFVATLGAAVWAVSIGLFLSLSTSLRDLAPMLVIGIYTGAILMDIGLLAYNGWKYRTGRVLTICFLMAGTLLAGLFVYQPSLLYDKIIISNNGNSVNLIKDWYYYAYIAYFIAITFTFLGTLFYKIKHTTTRKLKIGNFVFLVGLSITGTLSLVFDLLLPLVRYDLIWIGPMAIGITIIGFYYAILKFRMIALTASWMKTLSYIILILSGIACYMVLFFVVFVILFKTATPSTQVVLLNLIMIALIILLLPAMNELLAFANSLISDKKIDLLYVVKKLERVNLQNTSLKELAGFLADHLHIDYVGILLNDKLYSSNATVLSADIMKEIKILSNNNGDIWKDMDNTSGEELRKVGITMVGELRGEKGKQFGLIILGKQTGHSKLERQELVQSEMIINLAAVAIEPKNTKKVH